jgi:hypothetical protein
LLRQKWTVLLLTTVLTSILPGLVDAGWKRVQLAGGAQACQDEASGAQFKPPYTGTADVTKACNSLTSFVPWVGTAQAAPFRYSPTGLCPNGTVNTAHLDGGCDPIPATLAWDDAGLAAALAAIALQSTGTATNLSLDAYITGTTASSATCALRTAVGHWSVTTSAGHCSLVNAGSNVESVAAILDLTASALTDSAGPFTLVYQSPPGADTLAPPIPTDIQIVTESSDLILSGDVPWDACGNAVCKGTKDVQLQKDGSGTLVTITTNPGFSCNPTLTNIGAMTTIPTATQTGNDWAMSSAGTLDGTADAAGFVNCSFSGVGFTAMLVNSIGGTPTTYRKDVVARRESQTDPASREIYAGFVIADTGDTYFFVDARLVTGQGRQHIVGPIAGTLPACVKLTWDASNSHKVQTSTVTGGKCNQDWVTQLANYTLAFPTTTYAGQMVTSTTGFSGTAVTVANQQFDMNNQARWTYTDTTSGTHTYAARSQDLQATPNSSAYSPTKSGTPTGGGSSAIKFQPGWYGMYNITCAPLKAGCDSASIVANINAEICPNANLVGMKLSSTPAFLIPDTPGNYTGNSSQGFTVIDAVLAALQNCAAHGGSGPKYLILLAQDGTTGGYGAPNQIAPAFTYPASGCGLYTCVNGTATGSNYGVVPASQPSQPGMVVKLWKDDWRDLAIAAITAYCARYDSNPSFYTADIVYYNTSLPFQAPLPSGYDEATFNAQFRAYLTAARAACPTTNVSMTLDFASPHPAMSNTNLNHLLSIHGTMANTDTVPNTQNSWGQQVFSGQVGGTDYRGVARFFAEVESPDMCGYWWGNETPAAIFDMLQNGTANSRATWPNTIVVSMATECDSAGVGWTAWKTFINSVAGKVMNGRQGSLLSVAQIKATWCESSMTCP